jgi:hypothetical protein
VEYEQREKAMPRHRSLPALLLVYSTVVATVILGGGWVAASVIGNPEEVTESQRTKSILDERIATAREIKAILARPQPKIEPLPPITATLANPNASKVAIRSPLDQPKKHKLSPGALDAMAMGTRQDWGSSFTSYAPVDRGAIAGW